MQYLLLIYDNEQRWAKGYDPAELSDYRAFGQQHAEDYLNRRCPGGNGGFYYPMPQLV